MPRWLGVLAAVCLLAGTPRALAQLAQQSSASQRYAVDGLALGARIPFDSPAYREYKCSPSDQFDGFTWCQKARQERGQRGPSNATHSVLHARDGSVVYVNRYQEPIFFVPNEAERDIQSFSRKFGEQPRITRVPPGLGFNGILASWGKTVLEPLDIENRKAFAESRRLTKGYYIDFIGNFNRSAKDGLPIYRISGGAGFVWVASFDQRGRGSLRLAAVDASAFYPELMARSQPETQNSNTHVERAEGEISASEKPNAVIARQTLEQAAGKAKADSDVLREESETAKHDTQLAKPEIERLRPEGAKRNAALERLETEKTAAEAKAHTMESVAYGGIVISILLLAIVSYVLFVNRRKATAAKREGVEPGTKPSEVIGDSAVIARSSEGGDSQPSKASSPPELADAHAVHAPANTGAQNTASKPAKGLTGFFKRLAQYYAEFLSTDFKKQRLPRRRLENVDALGRLVGIPLRKYPGFQQKLWGELAKPIGAGLSLMVSRGSWRAVLPKAVVETTATYIAQVAQKDVDAVVNGVMKNTLRLAKQKDDDPDIAFEQFIEEVRASLARGIIGPLLDRMEGFFARTENKPVESLRELEDQLSARLGTGIEKSSGAAFSKLLVEGSSESLEGLLRDQLEINLIRRELEAFFATFTAADLYVDLSDLVRSFRLVENADFYMHIGELHHAGHVFPIFYIPFTAERTEQGFKIHSEPRLYVNKRAMDYVAQEVAKAEGRATIPSMLRERIFYLSPEQSALGEAQKIFDDLAGSFNLRAEIDFKAPRDQKVSSLLVVATNRLSFSLFDRSDDSIVNDYEALLTGIEAGNSVVGFFESLIDEFLLKNPISVRADIDGEWADMPMPQRLVFDSPLPLVEEQRKILSAIKHSKSRFIAVEGPPGTGKSHTITAVAFDLILAGKNLLVLSDKKEALDVVEDKLNQALTKVRPSEDFPNPILRLGMDASNYGQLLKKSAIERLQVNQRVVRQRRPEREKALVNEHAELVKGLEKTAETYAQIDIAQIAELERDTADLAGKNPDAASVLADQRLSELADNFGVVSEHLRSHAPLAAILRWQGAYPGRLNEISHLATALSSFPAGSMDIGPIIAFSLARLRALEREIKAIEDSKNAIFGYLFAGKKLREIARKLYEECGLECEHPHRDLAKLKLWRNNLHKIRDFLAGMHLETEFEVAVVLIAAKLVGADKPALAPAQVLDAARHLDEAMKLSTPLLASARGKFYFTLLDGSDVPLALLDRLGTLKRREADICEKFTAIPQVDYIGAKTKIESLNTQLLAERIDERLIEFYDHKKNDALALGKIIREKQRFPVDKFADIQRAFPCIIAGLRDYAEFIPLERELFDLVIIDEASQVSIAQALPAIIRAKKVLVLGDRNQFGNVKTSNASHEVNAAYMQDLIRAFSEDFANVGQEVRTKIDYFNIRRSVLDFIEPISNFSIQLKKHFRSYPEMISFSSKYFYGDSLQVMKIRGKLIEDVIEFDGIEHDGLVDQRNVNALEGRRIIDRIAELIDLERAPSVGVITPHTEQQAFIGKLVHEHPRSDEFYDKLRLKVMTFDTCQGEEREVIFYSLVATAEKDRLAYVFPSKLDRDKSDEVDHNLRLQRLNVGLSRGQEKIIFVHSKPLDLYSSALRTALFHYRSELERAKSMPTENDLDEASPMERQVLHWLGQVPLIRDLDGDCEIIAQFELGKYLKQLDPTYHHPDYCVDFLIRVSDGAKQHQLVLEYDGFEFHFAKGVPPGMINSSTWRMYLTAEDLEREKVLESFGVQMIRLNKFNLGKDPVATIDSLLRERLDGMNNGRQPHDLVKSVAEKANEIEEGLKTGDYKRCKKCDRDLPVEMFQDSGAKSGFGRLCRECKSTAPSANNKPRFRRRYRRW